jgi:DNA adenine methylase
MLRRLGNKSRVANKIIKHFPEHRIYVEPFFGAGGMYFNKPKAKYNILNDLDDDVFNLFMVTKNRKKELIQYLNETPYSQSLFNYWKTHKEDDEIAKAVRFLFLSNFGYMGKPETFLLSCEKSFKILVENIYGLEDYSRAKFSNMDFRKVITKLKLRHKTEAEETFIYNDPPYLETTNNYSTETWKEKDVVDLFKVNMEMADRGCKFAISEFNHPFILKQANEHGLEVIEIGERCNLKNRRIEILIVNYDSPELYGLFGKKLF